MRVLPPQMLLNAQAPQRPLSGRGFMRKPASIGSDRSSHMVLNGRFRTLSIEYPDQ